MTAAISPWCSYRYRLRRQTAAGRLLDNVKQNWLPL